MVTIVERGSLPQDKVYAGRCSNCGTRVQFSGREGTYAQTGYNETSITVPCPLEGCHARVYGQEVRPAWDPAVRYP